jgi:Leucine-rich repeat (LRR) protein
LIYRFGYQPAAVSLSLSEAIVNLASTSNATACLDNAEYNALSDLYTSTDGLHWNWKGTRGHWNFASRTINPCNATDKWQGISCILNVTTDSYHVVTINLEGYNLHGTIPNSIDAFKELTVLRLFNNSLDGTIPSEIGHLYNLTYLNLTYNPLHGNIPSSIGNLIYLTDLYICLTTINRQFDIIRTLVAQL